MYITYLLILVTLFSVEPPEQQELEMKLSLMYRRSGDSAMSFNQVAESDTVHFYQRSGNPYFRTYTVSFRPPGIVVKNMTVESYKGSQLLKTTNPRSYSSGQRVQFVDTYVDKEEDLVKVYVHYFNKAMRSEKDFVFYIKPDKDLY